MSFDKLLLAGESQTLEFKTNFGKAILGDTLFESVDQVMNSSYRT